VRSQYTEDKPRILIAEGPWGIKEGHQFGILGYGTVDGYDKVTHKCKWKTNWFCKTYTLSDWMMKQGAPHCPHCGDDVPSMIQTLWTLKSMDKIQNDATYGKKPWPSSFYMVPGQFYLQGTLNMKPGQIIEYDPKKVKL